MQLLRIDWNVLFTIINLLILYFGLRKIFDQAGDKCHGTAQTDDRRSDGGCEKDYGAGE